MIANDRQYHITMAAIRRFERALEHADEQGAHLNPRTKEFMKAQIESELDILRAQVAEYEAYRSGEVTTMTIESFNELPDVLVRARIAAGLTQKGLADLLGIKAQQIQRYETLWYEPASFARLKEIVLALGLKVRIQVELPTAEERARLQDLDARWRAMEQAANAALAAPEQPPRRDQVA